MKEIGGYFALETNDFGSIYHDNAIAVNSGRNALEYILLVNNYKKIYLPCYTCDVMLQPIKKLNIKFEFYYIDKNFFPIINSLESNAALLYVNYFGIMSNKISILQDKYKNLIIDNAQAFFAKPIESIPTFYSPRKFFGLPDGGFVYAGKKLKIDLEIDKSGDRILHLINRIEDGAKKAYTLFQQNELKINDLPLMYMSRLTKKMLRNIDFKFSIKKRNNNFIILHDALKKYNNLSSIIKIEDVNGPMVYPFLFYESTGLRYNLIKNNIFVATYWNNVLDWCDKTSYEYFLTKNLIPVPVDQRYGNQEMEYIIKVFTNYLKR